MGRFKQAFDATSAEEWQMHCIFITFGESSTMQIIKELCIPTITAAPSQDTPTIFFKGIFFFKRHSLKWPYIILAEQFIALTGTSPKSFVCTIPLLGCTNLTNKHKKCWHVKSVLSSTNTVNGFLLLSQLFHKFQLVQQYF